MKKVLVIVLILVMSSAVVQALKIVPRPNPWNYVTSTATGMTFPLVSGATEAHLKIFNLNGDLVFKRTANSGELTAGIVWDGKNNSGFLVATGVYFYSVEITYTSSTGSKTETASGKLLFIR